MDKREVIKLVKMYKDLLAEYIKFDKVYLYGSYANNTYTENSDIDVAIISNNLSEDFFSVNPILWKLRRKIDDRIEPIIIDKNNDDSGFMDIILKTGLEIE